MKDNQNIHELYKGLIRAIHADIAEKDKECEGYADLVGELVDGILSGKLSVAKVAQVAEEKLKELYEKNNGKTGDDK